MVFVAVITFVAFVSFSSHPTRHSTTSSVVVVAAAAAAAAAAAVAAAVAAAAAAAAATAAFAAASSNLRNGLKKRGRTRERPRPLKREKHRNLGYLRKTRKLGLFEPRN